MFSSSFVRVTDRHSFVFWSEIACASAERKMIEFPLHFVESLKVKSVPSSVRALLVHCCCQTVVYRVRYTRTYGMTSYSLAQNSLPTCRYYIIKLFPVSFDHKGLVWFHCKYHPLFFFLSKINPVSWRWRCLFRMVLLISCSVKGTRLHYLSFSKKQKHFLSNHLIKAAIK